MAIPLQAAIKAAIANLTPPADDGYTKIAPVDISQVNTDPSAIHREMAADTLMTNSGTTLTRPTETWAQKHERLVAEQAARRAAAPSEMVKINDGTLLSRKMATDNLGNIVPKDSAEGFTKGEAQAAVNQGAVPMDASMVKSAIASLGDKPGENLQLKMPEIGQQRQASPLVFHPGRNVVGSGGIPDDIQKQIVEGPEGEAMALGNLAKVQGQATDVIGNMMDQAADEAKVHMANRAELQAKRDAQVDAAIARREELSRTQAEMNPDGSRYWKNPGSILMAIGAVLTPGQAGMDRMDAAIQRDINEQKTAFDQQGEKAKMQDTLIAKYDAIYADRTQRDKAAQADAYQNAALRMQAFAEKSKSAELKAKAQVGAQQLMSHRAMLLGQLAQMDYQKPYTTGGTPGGKAEGYTLTSPDGKTYRVQDKEIYGKLALNLGYTSRIQENMNKALALRKQYSNSRSIPKTEGNKLLKSLAADTDQIITVRQGQGAMSKGDQEVAEAARGVFDGFFDSDDTVIKAARDRAGKAWQMELQATRAEEVSTGYGTDKTGQVVPTMSYDQKDTAPKAAMPAGRPLK